MVLEWGAERSVYKSPGLCSRSRCATFGCRRLGASVWVKFIYLFTFRLIACFQIFYMQFELFRQDLINISQKLILNIFSIGRHKLSPVQLRLLCKVQVWRWTNLPITTPSKYVSWHQCMSAGCISVAPIAIFAWCHCIVLCASLTSEKSSTLHIFHVKALIGPKWRMSNWWHITTNLLLNGHLNLTEKFIAEIHNIFSCI